MHRRVYGGWWFGREKVFFSQKGLDQSESSRILLLTVPMYSKISFPYIILMNLFGLCLCICAPPDAYFVLSFFTHTHTLIYNIFTPINSHHLKTLLWSLFFTLLTVVDKIQQNIFFKEKLVEIYAEKYLCVDYFFLFMYLLYYVQK